MTDRPLGAPHPDPVDGPTRDIRLPPLAGRPPADVPAQWAGAAAPEPAGGHGSPPLQEPPVQRLPAVASVPLAVDPDPTVVVPPVGTSTDTTTVLEEPTGQTASAPPPRERTRPFTPPAQQEVRRPAPAAPQTSSRNGGRTSTWVLLVLLPVLVIAGAGVLLFLTLSGG